MTVNQRQEFLTELLPHVAGAKVRSRAVASVYYLLTVNCYLFTIVFRLFDYRNHNRICAHSGISATYCLARLPSVVR